MHRCMFFVVNGVDVGASADENFAKGHVTGNDGQMQRVVAIIILVVDDAGLSIQQQFGYSAAFILGAIMQGGFI